MNFAISWVLSLFKKPEVEVTFEPEAAAWPFPVPVKKPAKKKPVAKKAAVVAKTVAKKKVAKKKAK